MELMRTTKLVSIKISFDACSNLNTELFKPYLVQACKSTKLSNPMAWEVKTKKVMQKGVKYAG